jgi:hypothetical protein
LNVLLAEADDKHTAARLVHDQALLLQLVQRFANRGAADMQLAAEFALVQPVSGFELAGEHGIDQDLGDILSQRGCLHRR